MTEKFSLALTPEEARELLIARIERSLADSGVTLPPETRAQIAACLPLPTFATMQAAPPEPVVVPSRYKPTVHEAQAVMKLHPRDRAVVSSGSRAKLYRPTAKAKPVDEPLSTSDRVLNLILKSDICTLTDLVKGTHRPKKALYTALWRLKKDGLIASLPLATAADTNN